MTIAFSNSTTAKTTTVTVTSLAVAAPGSLSAGDLMMAFITYNSGGLSVITPPAGWNGINGEDQFTGPGSEAYYKVATASEPSTYTWLFGVATSATISIIHLTGSDPVTPIRTSNISSAFSNTTCTFPTLTGVQATDMVVAFGGAMGLAPTVTMPSTGGWATTGAVTATDSGKPPSQALSYKLDGVDTPACSASTSTNINVISVAVVRATDTSISFTLVPSTPSADMSVTVMGIDSDDDTLNCVRNNPDGSQSPCRNATDVTLVGAPTSYQFFDFEASLNAPVSYQVTLSQHNVDGSVTQRVGVSPQATITFTDQMVWLKSLTQSTLSMEVEIASMANPTYPARQQVNPIIGSRYPVVLSDVQGSRTGAFVLTTYTLADRLALKTLLDNGEPLFMQFDQNQDTGDGAEDMYFVIGDYDEERPSIRSIETVRQWGIAFTEIAQPSGILTSIPGNSWLQVSTQFADWNAVLTSRSSWLDVLNRPGP